MEILVTGLVLFLGVHSIAIIAPGVRERARSRLGQNAWQGLYSLVSLAGFVLLVYGFGLARRAPEVLYTPPPMLRHVTFLLMLPVFPLLLAAYLPGKIKTAMKHPMLVAVKLWAFAHLLSNGTPADVVLFGAFLIWAVLDRISLKRRPPQALRTAPAGRFNDLIAVAAGLALYLAFIFGLHLKLIGVAPLG
jgi:uncharacterized membrane protein